MRITTSVDLIQMSKVPKDMRPSANTLILGGILCALLAILAVEVTELMIERPVPPSDQQKINERWLCEKMIGAVAEKDPTRERLNFLEDPDHAYHHCLKYLE